jgi:hypothetical protein
MIHRMCRYCKVRKPITDFRRERGRKCKRCASKQCMEYYDKRYRSDAAFRILMNCDGRVRRINKTRNNKMVFTITVKDIVVPKRCPYLGCKLLTTFGGVQKWNTPTIDRIDNTKGYVPGNVIVCSLRANRMKAMYSVEMLQKFAVGILTAFPTKNDKHIKRIRKVYK